MHSQKALLSFLQGGSAFIFSSWLFPPNFSSRGESVSDDPSSWLLPLRVTCMVVCKAIPEPGLVLVLATLLACTRRSANAFSGMGIFLSSLLSSWSDMIGLRSIGASHELFVGFTSKPSKSFEIGVVGLVANPSPELDISKIEPAMFSISQSALIVPDAVVKF